MSKKTDCGNTNFSGTSVCNYNARVVSVIFIKIPPKSKQQPESNKGNMKIFLRQKLKPHHFISAQTSGHIIIQKVTN